ncbi:MAG: tRNA (adenosine(37)-N6)-threonylcarbamoyltransferase complex transferase subunit TsaD [Clostridia bacterium]|nr:tRNA (adenosine(37)-N6)-threonylcarbamoyltransferase complex transferase subunit TsaD [Clostridia bacterium]
MLILGIESSCDETSAAVVRQDGDGKLTALSNVVASQVETHRLYGGVVPEIAGRAHIEAVSRVVGEALRDAGVSPAKLDGVAVTSHPGLIGALLVGVNFAKAFAFSNKLPLLPVNHVHAHTAAAYLTDPELKPPFLALVVSGGHTSFYLVHDYTHYEELGGTRDDAAGEAFDKIGRVIGLPYPGGAAMDKLAKEGDERGGKKCVSLPSPALSGDNLDFSFSGLKTAALNYLNSQKQKGEDVDRALFASAFTEAVVSAVTKKVPAALERSGCRRVVLAGGVAANSHLRARLDEVCRANGAKLVVPPRDLCGDNAAMVAAQGVYELLAGNIADTYLNASACD